jgi:hypothetical protein
LADRRALALGGLVGPAGFLGAWVVGGALTTGYSPVEDAISRLAAVDASTRGLMTAGFVTFGVGVPLYGIALRQRLPGRAWVAAVATGLATLGVAAAPLDHSSTVDLVHGSFASAGYATLAAVPLLAAGPLRRAGRAGWAAVSLTAGVASALCLLATLAGSHHGLFQRAGLTIGDAWLVASAVALLRGTDAG